MDEKIRQEMGRHDNEDAIMENKQDVCRVT